MFALIAAFGLVVALAVIPSALLSMLVLLRAYVVRLRARIEARRATEPRPAPDRGR